MNRIWIIVIAIAVVLALCVGIAFYFWNKDQQEKAEANRALHNTYSYTAGGLHLDVDTSEYVRTGDAHDIELTPTDSRKIGSMFIIRLPKIALIWKRRQKKLLKEKSMDPRIQWSLMITSM